MSAHSRPYLVGGILICLAGAVFFSTKAIFVKLTYLQTEVDPVTLLALRMIFSLPFFVVSAFVSSSRSGNVRFTRRQWMMVAAVGCLGYYISSFLDFVGLQYVSAGIERLILFIYPTLVLLITALLFGVRVKKIQWLAVIVTYAGLIIAFAGEVKVYDDPPANFYFGSILILACAVTYALYIVGSGRLIPVVGASKFNSYAMSFACVAVLIHFFLTGDKSLLHQPMAVYGYAIAMALLATVIPSYLVAEGIRRIGPGNAAIVGSAGPVSTILQAYFFLGEPIHGPQIAGTVMIIAGVLIISRDKKVQA